VPSISPRNCPKSQSSRLSLNGQFYKTVIASVQIEIRAPPLSVQQFW
jgi:hypothetical protein